MDFLNTWNFRNWVCARMTIMLGSLSICGLLTKHQSLGCCQDFYHFKIQHFWKVFDLQAIRNQTTCESSSLPLLMLIMKI